MPKGSVEAAVALRERYVQLVRRADSRRSSKAARRERRQFERQILSDLTPLVFRELLIYEIWRPNSTVPSQLCLVPRIFELASKSLRDALRLAHLFIHATFFHRREEDLAGKAEVPEACLQLCFTGMTAQITGLLGAQDLYLHGHSFISCLVDNARRGKSDDAVRYLGVMFVTIWDHGFHLDPVLETQWSDSDTQRLRGSMNMSPEEVRPHKIGVPFAWDRKGHETLKGIFDRQLDDLFAGGETVAQLSSEVSDIPATAFARYLSDLWHMVERSVGQEHSVVLSEGRDKIALAVPAFQAAGLGSFSFVREDASADSGWCAYPCVHLRFFWNRYGEHVVTQATIREDGLLEGLDLPHWPSKLERVLHCIIFDAYAEIVLPRPERSNARHARQTSRPTSTQGSGGSVFVHPHFRTLAEGWQASDERIARSLEIMGMAPPPGMTFVDEFDREFPGASPRQLTQDLWTQHENLSARFVYTDDSVGNIIQIIRTYSR